MTLEDPRGRVRRDAEGLHVLGLRVPPAEPVAEDEPPATDPEPTVAVESQPAEPPTGPALRVDRVLVSGLDFGFEDATVEPPFRLPLADLDVDVRDVRWPPPPVEEERPIRFQTVLRSGRIPHAQEAAPGDGRGARSDR